MPSLSPQSHVGSFKNRSVVAAKRQAQGNNKQLLYNKIYAISMPLDYTVQSNRNKEMNMSNGKRYQSRTPDFANETDAPKKESIKEQMVEMVEYSKVQLARREI